MLTEGEVAVDEVDFSDFQTPVREDALNDIWVHRIPTAKNRNGLPC